MNIGDYPRTADVDNHTFDPAIFQTLGGEVEEAADGRRRVRFPANPAFTIPGGFIQGGIQAAMIDEAMTVAVRIEARFPERNGEQPSPPGPLSQ